MARQNLGSPLVFCLVLIATMTGACGGLTQSDKPAVTSWWLEPYTAMTQTAPTEPASPVIVSISAVPGLDTDRVLALSADAEIKPYSAARWVDSLPELTESLVSRTLEASGRFEPVTGRARSASRPCDLQLELREFYATLDSGGQTSRVHVAFNGNYQCESGQSLPIQLKSSLPVGDNRMSAIVATFQRAMDDSMQGLLQELP